jgi:hypothetical protein
MILVSMYISKLKKELQYTVHGAKILATALDAASSRAAGRLK